MPDLWPDDFGVQDVTPPIGILREQAEALAKKTKGLVIARVVSGKNDTTFFHRFVLEVPTLEDYSFTLFTISHTILLYPVHISGEGLKSSGAKNPEDFAQNLREVLGTPTVKKAVLALQAQASATDSKV